MGERRGGDGYRGLFFVVRGSVVSHETNWCEDKGHRKRSGVVLR